jgi:tripartite-type tricarboxylate transporter receptor subunit TctC
MNRREIIKLTASAVAIGTISGVPALAQDWNPRRPINVVVPFNPGGGVDTYARAVTAGLQEKFGVPFVIANKPGSGGLTGAIEASNAKPDGQTLLFTSFGSFLLGSMFKDAPVNPIDSFDTVSQAGRIVFAIAVPMDSPFQNATDMIEAARANPGGLRWAHAGRGGTTHIPGQALLDANEVTATDVPFKGGAKIRAAILGKQVDFGILGVQQSFGFEEEMQVLGVFSDDRYPLAPEIPTFVEQGLKSVNIDAPIGLTAPKGTDPTIIAALESAMADIVNAPEFAEAMAPKGLTPSYKSASDAVAGLEAMRDGAMPILEALKASN